MKKRKREKLILPKYSWDLDKLRKIAQKIKEYERLEDEKEKTILGFVEENFVALAEERLSNPN